MGPEKVLFRVHKDALCRKSPVLNAIFNGKSTEAETNSANLPDIKVDSFDVILGWIFQGTVRPITSGIREGLDVWILADKLLLPDSLKDNIMDVWIRKMKDQNKLISLSTMSKAYEMTANSSPFRKLAVDVLRFVLAANGKIFLEGWPSKEIHKMLVSKPDLMDDLLKSMREMPTASDPRRNARCCYHCYAEGENCYAKEVSTKRTQEDRSANH